MFDTNFNLGDTFIAVSPGQEGLVVFDGVQLVCGRVAALAWKLSLGVVGPRAARDVDVAPTEVTASFQGWRGGGNAVDDDAWREKVRVLKQVKRERKKKKTVHPRFRLLAVSISVAMVRGSLAWLWVRTEQIPVR